MSQVKNNGESKRRLEQALLSLMEELGFKTLSQLWDSAGESANRANWYKRISFDSDLEPSKKHITKLIRGLENNGYTLSLEVKQALYAATETTVTIIEQLHARPQNQIHYQTNSLFQARPGEFKLLEDWLLPSNPEPVRIGLIGAGGIGKTQLAAEIANRYQSYFPDGIFWLTATGTTQYEWEFKLAELAFKTDYLPPHDNPGYEENINRRARYFCRYLANHPKALLILDNVEKPSLITLALPELAGNKLACAILYTSRVKQKLPGVKLHQLQPLSQEAALNLLLQATRPALLTEIMGGVQSEEALAAATLCQMVGNLPLALMHLWALLNDEPALRLTKLVEVLKQRGAMEMMKGREDELNSLLATFKFSWEKVEDLQAQALFKLAALFPEATPIPAWLLGLVTGLGESWESLEPLKEACQVLYRLSLLEELSDGQLQLHPLTREFGRRLVAEERDKGASLLVQAGERLATAFENIANLVKRASQAEGYFGCVIQLNSALEYLYSGQAWLETYTQTDILNLALERLERVKLWLDKEAPLLGMSGLWPTKMPGLFYQQMYNRALEEEHPVDMTTMEVPERWVRQLIRIGTEDKALVKIIRAHKLVIFSAKLSPDNRFILTGSEDNTARLWEASSGRLLFTFSGHTHFVRSVAFSSNGQFILTGSFDNTIRLWDASSGKFIRAFEGHTEAVTSVAFSPDDSFILSGSRDRTARIWELATGKLLLSLNGHQEKVTEVAFSPDGKLLATSSKDGKLRLWEANSGKLVHTFEEHQAAVRCLAFSPDGRYILSGSDDKTARLWDVTTREPVQIFKGHLETVKSVAFSSTGNQIITGTDWERVAHLWDVTSGRRIASFTGHNGCIYAVAFFNDGSKVLTASEDRTVRLWEVRYSQPLNYDDDAGGMISDVVFSPDGTKLLSGHWDGTARLWEVAGERLLTVFKGHTERVRGVAFSSDGKFALTGGFDNRAILWEVATGRIITRFEGHIDAVRSVDVSKDHKKVLTGSYDGTAKLWDVTSGETLITFRGHQDWVVKVAFSNDGTKILTGSKDHTARMWDAQSGEELLRLKAHKHWVLGVLFSPDDTKCVTCAAAEARIRIWDTKTGQLLSTLEGHNMDIYHLSFSPDSRMLVSCDRSGEVRFWDFERKQLMAVYTASYEVGDVYWYSKKRLVLADKGGPRFQPYLHQIKLEGF